MVANKILSTPQPTQQSAEDKQEQTVYNPLEMLWFCLSAKYQDWFTASDIKKLKETDVPEKEIEQFLKEACRFGFFQSFSKDGCIKFKGEIKWLNASI